MCLTCRDPRPNIADDDIVVYKVVTVFRGKFRAAIQRNHYYEPGKTYSQPEVFDNIEAVLYSQGTIVRIYEGYHSYSDFEAAKFTAVQLCSPYNRAEQVILKCIIPKGAKYFCGEDWHAKERCSDKLEVVEEVYRTKW